MYTVIEDEIMIYNVSIKSNKCINILSLWHNYSQVHVLLGCLSQKMYLLILRSSTKWKFITLPLYLLEQVCFCRNQWFCWEAKLQVRPNCHPGSPALSDIPSCWERPISTAVRGRNMSSSRHTATGGRRACDPWQKGAVGNLRSISSNG